MELKLVELQSFFSPLEAHLSKNVLEVEGIPSFFQNEYINSTLTFHQSPNESVKLMVWKSDYYRAKRIMKQSQTENPYSLIEDNSDLSPEELAKLEKEHQARDNFRRIAARGLELTPVIILGIIVIAFLFLVISN